MADSQQQSLSNAPPATSVSGNHIGFNPQILLAQGAFLAMMATQSEYYNQMQQKVENNPANSPNPGGSISTSPFSAPPFGFMIPPGHQTWNDSMPQVTSVDMISPNEEDHIVRVLSAATCQGQNYNDALNFLDGVNNHASSTWKDHYLMHHRRFDDLVLHDSMKEEDVTQIQKETKTLARKPTTSAKKINERLEPLPEKPKDSSDGKGPSKDESISASEGDLLDTDVDSAEDEKNMGIPGGHYTDSDIRLLAKHIASQDPLAAATHLTNSFAKRYTGRSGPAWGALYRKRQDEIDRLAERYRNKQVACDRPSWTKGSSSRKSAASPSKIKRSHPEAAPPQEKRKRTRVKVEKPIHDLSWKDFT